MKEAKRSKENCSIYILQCIQGVRLNVVIQMHLTHGDECVCGALNKVKAIGNGILSIDTL